ncbi:MAG TPA: hypothetical protein VNX47_14605 [Nevskia sp.]|jgi:hypothetical protein|nr:hypothetical protein [Nevskia sp.]
MRKHLATLGLLLTLALQPALAGGWSHREERREPPRQQQRPPEPPRQQRPPEPPRQMYMPRQEPMRPQNWAPQNRMSTGQAAQRAQQMNGGGRVLAVDPSESGYRVRVLKDGEVRSVYVPGQ